MSSKNKNREILDYIPFFYPCSMSRIYDILKDADANLHIMKFMILLKNIYIKSGMNI